MREVTLKKCNCPHYCPQSSAKYKKGNLLSAFRFFSASSDEEKYEYEQDERDHSKCNSIDCNLPGTHQAISFQGHN